MRKIAIILVSFCMATFAQQKGSFTDSRDGKKYKTVKIGTQTWMAQNLDYGGANDDIGMCYDKKPENCKKYGSLYSWDEAMKVCPPGWHLPSDKEWQVLVDFAGGDEAAGKKLKSKSGWSKHECKYTIESVSDRGKVTVTEHDNCAVTDEYGFAAFSGGFGFSGGSSYNVGNGGGWWSATESDASNAWNRIMHYSYELVVRGNSDKSYLLSVRCLQD
ncbi:MAG: hypothetical protein FWH22_01740 [Fibromonadales bacterium]|nr:hypothetical protein [Fibromonadales bacterium]